MKLLGLKKPDLHDVIFDVVNRSRGILELGLDETILEVNAKYLDAMGYRRDELIGRKHLVTVGKSEADLRAYEDLWRRLRSGEPMEREIKRISRDGSPRWFHCVYTFLRDAKARPVRVVMVFADITEQKMQQVAMEAQLDAIHHSSAVVECDVEGRIVDANANFLAIMGYSRDEIVGKARSVLIDRNEARSAENAELWARLARGESVNGDFRRIAKGGREVWIRGSYNPVLDLDGKLHRVIQMSVDVTAQLERRMQRERVFSDVDRRLDSITATVSSVAGEAGEAASLRRAPRAMSRRSRRARKSFPPRSRRSPVRCGAPPKSRTTRPRPRRRRPIWSRP
jgi:methyl-accepting chemotaxis protein